MSGNRKLQELAALAIGIKPIGTHPSGGVQYKGNDGKFWVFDPIYRDGEAFRLETALGMNVEWFDDAVKVGAWYENFEDHNDDKAAARRMAAVREAADIASSGGVPA